MTTHADFGSSIASRTAAVEGLRLHYLTAGQGPTVMVFHQYSEKPTSG